MTTTTRKAGMGSHQSHAMQTDIWLTPRHILTALGEFDLDPCAAPDPSIWPTAREHVTLPQDGMCVPWHGRVWLNPPYGRHVWTWLDRLAMHGTGTALIFARTETRGFIDTVWNGATAVLFLHGRLVFHCADGSLPPATQGGGNAGAPSCLVAYGHRDAETLLNSGLDGTYIDAWTAAR